MSVEKIRAVLIAPYQGLKELAQRLAKEQDMLDLTVVQADLKAALPIVNQFEQRDCQVVISRGGTAQLIREHTSVPVVEIPVSGYDIMRTLLLAKDYHLRSHMIGFPKVCQGAVAISHLLEIDIPHTIIHARDEVDEAVQKAKKNGAQVIIGDTVTVNTAQKYGLQGLLITSGRESVLEAFHQASQLCHSLRRSEQKTAAYEKLLDAIQEGVVILNSTGVIHYCNPSFRQLARLDDLDNIRFSMQDIIPGFARLVERLTGREHVRDLIRIDDQSYQVEGRLFFADEGQTLYSFTFYDENHPFRRQQDVQVNTIPLPMTSLLLLNGTGLTLEKLIEEGKRWANHDQPVLLFGERGTGKRLLAAAIHQSSAQKEGDLIEIEIFRNSEAAVRLVRDVIGQSERATYYVKGMERLSLARQDELHRCMRQAPGRFVFAFRHDPQALVSEKKLSRPIFEWCRKQSLYLPPLRERKEEIQAYIHMFIAQNNVKYGKQIVGMRQEVIDYLISRPWPGNVRELQDVIEQFVRQAKGPYIEGNVLHPAVSGLPAAEKTCPIDLTKTLSEIEQEVIQYVLKEENNNQTRAAKRLGINRSTLWRKLKQ
mgnify:FL=1